MNRRTTLSFLVVFVALAVGGCVPSLRPSATPTAPPPTRRPPTPARLSPTATSLPATPTQVPSTPPPTEPVASPSLTPSPVTAAAATPVSAETVERWEVRTLLAGPGEPGRLYALLADTASAAWPAERVRFLISDDYGVTWHPFPGGLPAEECIRNVNLDYATPDALYGSTCEGLFRWSGADWTLISPQQTGMVAVVYGKPEEIWATEPFGVGRGIIRSDEGGVTWARADSGLIQFNGVANLAMDPRDASTQYAIIWPKYGGTYLRRATASGLWDFMPTPLDNSQIGVGMTIDGATGALYVAVQSPSRQIWRTLNPNAMDVDDVRWELVHDFGENMQMDLLASGWSPEGLALYANLQPMEWHEEGWGEPTGELAPHRSLDGGHTWAPLVIP